VRIRKLLAALMALCLLTGCAAQSSVPAAESIPAAESSAPTESTPAAQSSAPQSGQAPVSAQPEQSAPTEENEVPAGGSVDGLSWKFETKRFSTTESSGREVYYFQFIYPVFSGQGSEELNDYVGSNYLNYMNEAEQKSGVDEGYLDGYKDYMDEESLQNMLPFYDELNLTTVWADEKYVSMSGESGFWSGGAHPYFYKMGSVIRRSDSLALGLDSLTDVEKLPELVKDRFPEDAYTDDEEFRSDMIERVAGMAAEPEAFRLEEGGLRLYYNVGDAVPRLEIFLPREMLEK
jgi:hypothetical protein